MSRRSERKGSSLSRSSWWGGFGVVMWVAWGGEGVLVLCFLVGGGGVVDRVGCFFEVGSGSGGMQEGG